MSKFETGAGGAVASGSPYATEIAGNILAQGGNAVDAVVAAWFALTVADPANTSLASRCQVLVTTAEGGVSAIDGATQAPSVLPSDKSKAAAAIPLPGALAAMAKAHAQFGNRSWSDLVMPAAILARSGSVVGHQLARAWAFAAPHLRRTDAASALFLRNGEPLRAGDVFRQEKLADTLEMVAALGAGAVYRGPVGLAISEACSQLGGSITERDLDGYEALSGEVVQLPFAGADVFTPGQQGWGHTVAQMLELMALLDVAGANALEKARLTALILHTCLADRPHHIGSLEPKAEGVSLAELLDPGRLQRMVAQIRSYRSGLFESLWKDRIRWPKTESGHTTHLTVLDGKGGAASVTTSIGPMFGSRVACGPHGFLLAHSYQMLSAPIAGRRDKTEMSPTLVRSRKGMPLLAVGAGGSERIPGAIAQVIAAALSGESLQEAVNGPRLNWYEGNLQIDAGYPSYIREALFAEGFPAVTCGRGFEADLGVVHAAGWNQATHLFEAAADLANDGAAGSPAMPASS